MTAPAEPSALNQPDPCVALSSRGTVTSVTLPPGSTSQYFSIAAAPSVPGFPVGMRSSTMLAPPNSDWLAPA